MAPNSPAVQVHCLLNGMEIISICPCNHIFAPVLAAGSHMELSFSLVDLERLDQVQCRRTEAAPTFCFAREPALTISHTFC